MSAGRCSVRSRSKSRPILVWLIELLKIFTVDVGVFVAASGQVDDEELIFGGGCAADSFVDCVRGFQRGNNSFEMGQHLGGGERVLIGSRNIFGTALIAQPGV